MIGRRLNRLSAQCNEVLNVASAIGREFTLEQLKPLIPDVTAGQLLQVLGQALAARLIEELPRRVGRYRFVAQHPFYKPVGHHTRVDLISPALRLVAKDTLMEGRLRSLRGMVLGMEDENYDRAQEAFNRALAIARGEKDTVLEKRTLAWSARVDRFHLRFNECLEKSQRAIDLAPGTDDYAEAVAHRWAARVLEVTGDLVGARRHAAIVLNLAYRLGDRARLTSALDINANLYRLTGDWLAARSSSALGLEVEPQSPQLLGGRVLLEYELGDPSQGAAHLERLLEAMRRAAPGPTGEYSVPAGVIPMVARITGVFDRLEIAQAAAETVLSSPSATPAAAMWARAGLALLAVLRGDAAVAGEQYTALQSQRGTMLSTGVSMAADRLLGLLSVTQGRLDEAMADFEGALTFCRKAGYRPELAWTCCDYADALLQRNGRGDRRRAKSLLDESLAISRELGMRPLMERVSDRLGGFPPLASHGSGSSRRLEPTRGGGTAPHRPRQEQP